MAKTPVPEGNYSPLWATEERPKPPFVGTERDLLIDYLEFYRRTVELKCAGVAKEKLSEQTMPPSTMTLHGLVRHLAGVERWWFHRQFAGEDVDLLYYSDDDPDQDFGDLSGDFDDALATWRAQCAHSREIVARTGSLDATGIRERTGEPVSLRRILLLMITEYARHSGHADFLREGIDGATGE
ncbi:MAG TPA: DinB family protein [Actinophytocola sp.]|jgi:hypothetical protein|uniref:DinB family protein n=1 Tax=Actinophytocola sp. TaxID=1872138 RepID=UPI002E07EE86|nr:DinB family protein [Actinophytocola sp.]